jgi:hypothetical protein
VCQIEIELRTGVVPSAESNVASRKGSSDSLEPRPKGIATHDF